MAERTQASAGDHPDMDYAEHERTYALFVRFVKWGTIVVAAIVAGLYIVLV